MKRVFLGMLMLTLVNIPLATAEGSKAEKVAIKWIFAECAVEEGFLLPERGEDFYLWMIGKEIKRGESTLKEIMQISNEASFKDLKKSLLKTIGGCSSDLVSESSKRLAHKFLRWLDKNY